MARLAHFLLRCIAPAHAGAPHARLIVRRLALLLPLAALGLVQPAAAQTAADDLQCLTALTALAGDGDPQTQQAGTFGTLYFTGKLLGANPGFDLESRMRGMAMAITGDMMPPIQQRCLQELGAVGERLGALGATMDTAP